MIDSKSFFFASMLVVIIALLFGVLHYLHIQYQFYVWEIFVDLKILMLVGILVLLFKKKMFEIRKEQFPDLHWNWKNNVVVFFLPALLSLTVIGVGLLFNEVIRNTLDNSATVILATIFDIPAIYIFSATSILIEEFFFREIFLKSKIRQTGIFASVLIVSGLWGVYNLSEFTGGDFDFVTGLVLFAYFVSIGILCSGLVMRYHSIWLSYSFRVGIVSLAPIILTSLLNESDSFFTTKSGFFHAEGILISIVFASVGLFLILTLKTDNTNSLRTPTSGKSQSA